MQDSHPNSLRLNILHSGMKATSQSTVTLSYRIDLMIPNGSKLVDYMTIPVALVRNPGNMIDWFFFVHQSHVQLIPKSSGVVPSVSSSVQIVPSILLQYQCETPLYHPISHRYNKSFLRAFISRRLAYPQHIFHVTNRVISLHNPSRDNTLIRVARGLSLSFRIV